MARKSEILLLAVMVVTMAVQMSWVHAAFYSWQPLMANMLGTIPNGLHVVGYDFEVTIDGGYSAWNFSLPEPAANSLHKFCNGPGILWNVPFSLDHARRDSLGTPTGRGPCIVGSIEPGPNQASVTLILDGTTLQLLRLR